MFLPCPVSVVLKNASLARHPLMSAFPTYLILPMNYSVNKFIGETMEIIAKKNNANKCPLTNEIPLSISLITKNYCSLTFKEAF